MAAPIPVPDARFPAPAVHDGNTPPALKLLKAAGIESGRESDLPAYPGFRPSPFGVNFPATSSPARAA